MLELRVVSSVCGYHLYSQTWQVALGEELYSEQELGNVIDRYAVAVK